MPTLYGPWQGSGWQARIYLTYTVTHSADRTQAIYNGSFGIEFEANVSDTTNSWSCTGDLADESGTNVSYDIPSGGGKKIFNTFSQFQKYGDGKVSASVSGINAIGTTVSASFTMDAGDLAPYFTDNSYTATTVTSTTATLGGFGATGNGGTLNNIQVEYNTKQSATGASHYTKGSYGFPTITGLEPNTLYWFRMRLSNNTYGFEVDYDTWHSFKTDSGLPGAPGTGWSFSDITQVDTDIIGNTIADNGGSAITGWDVQWNTSASATGATTYTNPNKALAGPITGLNPGTLYYARLRAKNANGYGAYSAWKSFTTLSGALVNVAGVWKEAVPYVCTAPGVWKISERYCAIDNGAGGVNWKK